MSLGARRRRPPTPGFVANELWRRADEVPSFHIAPARTQNARDLITGSVLGTYNSALPAWAVGPDRVLALPAANAPVIEYDPVTLQCLGARIWGVVTNQIRNNTGVGAVAGTPGTLPANWGAATPSNGLSRQIVGIGTVNGVDYIDIRYFGTTTAASTTQVVFENTTAVTAASGETWTGSVYLAIVGGSLSNINTPARLRVTGRNTSGTLQESQQSDNTIDSNLVRRSTTATFSNANTARVSVDFIFTYNSGVAIDVTYRLGLAQLEKSATMGPVVKTSGLAASSTADVWSIAGEDFSRIWNQSAATMYVEAVRDVVPGSEFPVLMTARAAALTERAEISYLVESSAGYGVVTGGVAQAEMYPSVSARTRRVAGAFFANDFAVSANGSAVLTDTSGAMPAVDRLFIGSTGAGQFLNGYIRELAIFRSRRRNANIQALTS